MDIKDLACTHAGVWPVNNGACPICFREVSAEVKRLEGLSKRLAKALFAVYWLDYPWKDGSLASKALDEAEVLLRKAKRSRSRK